MFGILIKQANNVIIRDSDKFAQTMDLTGVQMSIIDFISRVGDKQDVFQKNIEEEFNTRRATATSALKLMEEKDLIVRIQKKDDARLKRIILTPKSYKLADKINKFFDDSEKRMAQSVGIDNVDLFKSQLKNIIHDFAD